MSNKTSTTARTKVSAANFVFQPFAFSLGFDLTNPDDQATFIKSVQDYVNQLNQRINNLGGVAGIVTLKVTDSNNVARVATFTNGILTLLK